MKCPRCENSILDERLRDGLTIDVCQQCRGIWLDRGELERLMARAIDEQGEHTRRGRRNDDDDEHHHEHRARGDWDQHGTYDDRPRRKRRWFESLTDIFD